MVDPSPTTLLLLPLLLIITPRSHNNHLPLSLNNNLHYDLRSSNRASRSKNPSDHHLLSDKQCLLQDTGKDPFPLLSMVVERSSGYRKDREACSTTCLSSHQANKPTMTPSLASRPPTPTPTFAGKSRSSGQIGNAWTPATGSGTTAIMLHRCTRSTQKVATIADSGICLPLQVICHNMAPCLLV
jgi:hypothetical protein